MEKWKTIPGWEGLYEVSNQGRVRSLHPNSRAEGGVLKSIRKGDGYYAVNLTKPGVRKMMAVHRAVLAAFVSEIPSGMHGSHLDGDKANNTLANLAIETPSANCARRAGHGTQAANISNATLCPETARDIRKRLSERREPQWRIAKEFGVSQSTVSRISSGLIWR